MSDIYESLATGASGPIVGAFAIAPNDAADLPHVTRQIFAQGAGNLAIVWQSGLETIEPVAAGERLPWRARRILATGTTATGIRGYF